MIRIRSQSGQVQGVEESNAVEYVDDQGKLAVVITQNAAGTVYVLTPGHPLFNAYCATQHMQPSTVHVHEPFQAEGL